MARAEVSNRLGASHLKMEEIRLPKRSVIFLIENQKMHQNDHFIVMPSQTLLHVLAYQRHHQGAHLILTSYLRVYVGVHYKKNNGGSSKLVPVSIVTLWLMDTKYYSPFKCAVRRGGEKQRHM
jgi:hypothetical protein